MIALSPGVAQGCFELLGLVSRSPLPFSKIVSFFAYFGGIRSEEIVRLAQQIGWIRANESGMAVLTSTGSSLISLEGYERMLRKALLDYIDVDQPPWVQCATYGRSRVIAFVESGIAQILVEAGLASGFNDEVVAFWDTLAMRARGQRDHRLLEIGRCGERLTLAHEEARTGCKPRWIAVNNNDDGYDVLSVVCVEDSRALTIEVKTSTQGVLGSMHLTRNEWETASERPSHLFHLWDVKGTSPRLAKIPVEVMAKHVPADAGEGKWESVNIPYVVFGSMFESADMN